MIDEYIIEMFNNFMGVPGEAEQVLLLKYEEMDIPLLQQVFCDVARKIIIKETEGDMAHYAVVENVVALQNTLVKELAEAYYTQLLLKEDIVLQFEDPDSKKSDPGFVYAVKESYIPVLNTILTASDMALLIIGILITSSL